MTTTIVYVNESPMSGSCRQCGHGLYRLSDREPWRHRNATLDGDHRPEPGRKEFDELMRSVRLEERREEE